jgi:hypothetical protein
VWLYKKNIPRVQGIFFSFQFTFLFPNVSVPHQQHRFAADDYGSSCSYAHSPFLPAALSFFAPLRLPLTDASAEYRWCYDVYRFA